MALGGDKALIVKNRPRGEAVVEYRIVDEVGGEALEAECIVPM